MSGTPRDEGGSAFPIPVAIGPAGDVYPAYDGMSLRSYFAGQALPAVIAEMGKVQGIGSMTFPSNVAAHARRIADALLDPDNEPVTVQDRKIMALSAALREAREYFAERADAEYTTDSAGPKGNAEMSLLVEIDEALKKAGA